MRGCAVKFSTAVDQFILEHRRVGRINSDSTELSYRAKLLCHATDVGNRDPAKTGRKDVQRTLSRWAHPNTQRVAHAALTSFYDWAVEEGIRRDNPARAVRRARKRPTSVYRLTRDEVVRMLDASKDTRRERWAIHLGFCAGARNAELRGLRGRHLARPGFVHFHPDFAKRGRERWVPVISELELVAAEIAGELDPDQFVLGARVSERPGRGHDWFEDRSRPASGQSVWRLVVEVAKRAGIAEHVHPHLLRHAFGDHVAKHAGLRVAQELLGHESVDTTAGTYVDRPTIDELAVSIHGFSYRGYPPVGGAQNPEVARRGFEPLKPAAKGAEPREDDSQPKEAGNDADPDGCAQAPE